MTSCEALKVLAKYLLKLLTVPGQMPLEQAEERLIMAYQPYFKARSNLPKWREEFQVGLVQVLAADQHKSMVVIKAQMKRKMYQCNLE